MARSNGTAHAEKTRPTVTNLNISLMFQAVCQHEGGDLDRDNQTASRDRYGPVVVDLRWI
jgi:hypothetical protein